MLKNCIQTLFLINLFFKAFSDLIFLCTLGSPVMLANEPGEHSSQYVPDGLETPAISKKGQFKIEENPSWAFTPAA